MESLKKKETWFGLALAVIVEPILQALFKALWPSAGQFFTKLVGLITFSSTWVRDTPYRTAAMDPDPLASLIEIFLIAFALPICVFGVLGFIAGNRRGRRDAEVFQQSNGLYPKGISGLFIRNRRSVRFVISVLLYATAFLVIQVFFVGSEMLNTAVRAKRLFSSDLAILRPALSPEESQRFEARFASMNGKSDFVDLGSEMIETAKSHGGVRLRPEFLTFINQSRNHERQSK